jgi:hypothetical protein
MGLDSLLDVCHLARWSVAGSEVELGNALLSSPRACHGGGGRWHDTKLKEGVRSLHPLHALHATSATRAIDCTRCSRCRLFGVGEMMQRRNDVEGRPDILVRAWLKGTGLTGSTGSNASWQALLAPNPQRVTRSHQGGTSPWPVTTLFPSSQTLTSCRLMAPRVHNRGGVMVLLMLWSPAPDS